MSNHESPFEIDPFQDTLAPLPAKAEAERGGKPLAMNAQILPLEHSSVQGRQGADPAPESGDVHRMAPEDAAPRGFISPATSRWKFWKRRERRDEQAEALRRGASEMVSLMRSIREHLEMERRSQDSVLRTVTPLPRVVENLQAMSARQGDTGRILSELRTTLEQRSERDGLLLRSLHRIGGTMANVENTFGQLNKTLAGMDSCHAQTAKSMELLGERVAGSGECMNESITKLRASEHDFAEYMSQSSRRSSRGMVAMCCCLLLSVVSVAFMFQENRKLLAAVQNNGALVVQVPRVAVSPERIAKQDEDEGDTESPGGRPGSGLAVQPLEEQVVPVDTEGRGLLSVTE